MCPAEAGKVQCPIKSRSMGRGIQLPLVDPEAEPRGAAQGLPPAQHHPGPRRRIQALAGPRVWGRAMAEGLLPAAQQRRGIQRLRKKPSRRSHRGRWWATDPRHRRSDRAARLPTGSCQPTEDQKLGRDPGAERTAQAQVHPPPPDDQAARSLDPDRPSITDTVGIRRSSEGPAGQHQSPRPDRQVTGEGSDVFNATLASWCWLPSRSERPDQRETGPHQDFRHR